MSFSVLHMHFMTLFSFWAIVIGFGDGHTSYTHESF